jgi:glutamate formiminotransferase / formiminotetrahydrofolate cyclodeaminase
VSAALVECVPNFSEGRDLAVVDAIVAAAASAGAAVLDRSSDPDHNRSVITLAGSPDRVAEAAFRAVAEAVARIDLGRHAGVHPRIGAADVVPFVPVSGISLDECAALAVEVGRRIWDELGVPVYLYEAAARRPERVNLADVRRDVGAGRAGAPDFGAIALHPSAGAAVVGARKFLVACNVNLNTPDVAVARRIARKVRFSSGGLPCVKALGLPLASRGLVQVSMNLTDFETTPVHRAFEAVREEAEREGVTVAGGELIGLIPRAALEEAAGSMLRIEGFHRGMILENRLEAALPPRAFESFVERLTGGGAAAAAAGAMAAALAFAVPPDSETLAIRRRFFIAAIDRDAAAWTACSRASQDEAEPLFQEATRIPLEVAEEAAALVAVLRDLAAGAPERFRSDLATADALARAAFAGAAATVRFNLGLMRDSETARAIAERLDGLV